MRNAPRIHRLRPVLEDIEPRILMSADHPLAAAAAGAMVLHGTEGVAAPAPNAQAAAAVDLVFIDHRVPDRDQLVADLQAQAGAGRRIEAVLLGEQDDAITRITDTLAQRQDVAALHLVGHGEDGRMLLGNGALDRDAVLLRAQDIAGWAGALTSNADLLLYGCDMASGSDGRALVQDLAQLTGADVAASTDRTGSAAMGGNWTLEMQTGHIEAQLAFDLQTQAQWQGVLATYTVTTTADSGAGSLRQAITDANNNAGADTIVFAIPGAGLQTISPTSALPTITGAVAINGYSQSDATANSASTGSNAVIRIALNGTGAGGGANGLNFGVGSEGSSVRGLAIGGFSGAGILTSVGGLTVAGNFIGTNAAGSAASANASGISVAGSGATTIGSVLLADRNLVSGNTNNIVSSATGAVTIQGNLVGTGTDGSTTIGTPTAGISISAGTANVVGGSNAGEGNVVAGGARGVVVTNTGTVASIVGNTIAQTSVQGIDLANDGVTANDAGDADTGANNLQNFPVITASQTSADGYVAVQGTLNSTASTSYRIDFYASPAGTTSREGRVYLGYALATTDGSGNATYAATLSGATVAVGGLVSATATRLSGTALAETSEISAYQATTAMNVQTVTTNADSGAGSLRAAITAANAASGPTLIRFNIAGNVVHTITLATLLPSITKQVVIDGSTDTGSVAANGGRPAIVLNVNGIAGDGLRLDTGSGGSTIRGLVVQNYGAGADTSAIRIMAGSGGNTIAGNYLGAIDASGEQAAVSSGDDGIWIESGNNIIGGSTAADRNVIGLDGRSDITTYGILVTTGNGNQILGNYVGVNAGGTAGFTGLQSGIWLNGSPANTVIQGNLASGAGDFGVAVNTSGAGTQVLSNRVGINAAGTARISTTASTGIIVYASGSGMLISGNWVGTTALSGISLQAGTSGVTVQGNRIGTDLAGTANWGGQQSGIRVTGTNHLIGGTGAGQGNVVAFSNQQGTTADAISVTSGTGNAILGNSIYGSNGVTGSLGIDLNPSGVTANDTGDADTGANNMQNYPVLTLARTNGSGSLEISGTLNSTANSFLRIELFANTVKSGSGYGEGQTYLGFVNVTTDASGNASFTTTLGATVAAGAFISATATKSNAAFNAFTDTSEFARSVVAISTTQTVLVVDTAADTLDGDTTSLSTLLASKGSDGFISLREALTAINNTPAGSLPTLVNFNISGSGVHTITLGSVLPTIDRAVVLDGTTDTASVTANGGRPAIVINGNGLNVDGLTLSANADGSTIRGLVVRNFGGAAINIAAASDGNTIVGNYLGAVAATGNLAAAANASYTVLVAGANNTIGGSTAADRNVLGTSGAGGVYGLLVTGATATGNQVLGNYIGIGADGSTAFSGEQAGISVLSGAATTRIQGNVIAANLDNGVFLSTAGTGTVVNNNLIGANAAGTARVGSPLNGIQATQAGAGTVITNNVIAGTSQAGIVLTGSAGGVTVQGNRIGTDAAGTANWGTSRSGIQIATSNNLIGGTGAGQGNTIANSNQAAAAADGIAVSAGTGNAFLGNSIYGTRAGTTGLGIDLDTSGVTVNDTGDADTGANNLQNFPVLDRALTNGAGAVEVSGTLNSTASTNLRIELFASPAGSGSNGEGRTYLGFVNVTTDASGNASFSTTLSATVAPGAFITATATRADGSFSSYSDTSEFSARLQTAAILTVDTVADTLGGDTSSVAALLANKGGDGLVSLREAIEAINNTAAGTQPAVIRFAIAGTGLHTIVLTSALPHIGRPVVIDATTDDSFAANGNQPAIQIDGNNNESGLVLQAGASGSTIRGLAITNFYYAGIYVEAGSNNNVIAGNYLGTMGAGGQVLGTTVTNGIWVDNGANTRVGGSTAADRNIIAGVTQNAILVQGAGAAGTVVQGNWIGVMPDGLSAVSSPGQGITVADGASNIQIGGLGAGEGNWIARTDYSGIALVDATDVRVQGNRIGTDAAGTANWGVALAAGMYIANGAADNLVQGNVVAFGGFNGGILLDSDAGAGNALVGNRIYGNAGLGIDLGFDGVTANDAGDADTGANDLQNYPVLTLARTDDVDQFEITGSIDSTANTYIRIELFSSIDNDPSGYGQAETFLGFVNVLTDGAGHADFSTTLTVHVAPGAFISATATRATDGSYTTLRDTSEFARSVVAINNPAMFGPFEDVSNVLVVDTAADTLDGDTTSLSTLLASKGADGRISLREAITAINNTPAVALPVGIYFDISGSGVHTLTLASELPTIAKPVVIDGTTDTASFSNNGNRPAIVLRGNGSGGIWTGLSLGAGSAGSTIRGLVVQNFYTGIMVGSDGNTIAGNYIGQLGTDGSLGGSATNSYGIVLRGAGNTIGGTTAANRNVISGNISSNVTLDAVAATGNRIIGNYIGTNAAGAPSGGGGFYGVWLSVGASNNRVGGTAAGEGNVIAGATGRGVWIDNTAGTGNAVLSNSIHSNSGLGIDLRTGGVSANDVGDPDTGPNNMQNFPVLTLVRTNGSGSVEVSGSINSNANSYIRIEIFANTANDSSGYGEGQTFLGFINVLTDGSGNVSFSQSFAATVAAGAFISATATKSVAGYGSFSDTSEFARSVVALSATQTVLVVDTADDTLDGDTTSLSTLLASKGADGFISLREAITAINNTPASSLPTLVNFNIAGSGVHTITLGSALPVIDRPVVIDGTTDTASVTANGGRPAIVLNGNGAAIDGLVLGANADGSTLRGLVVTNLTGSGIRILAGSDGNTIAGNYVGRVGANGLANALASGTGILVEGAGNTIGGSTAADRNILAGLALDAIRTDGAGATGNVVQGNWVNVLPDGLTTVASAGTGIFVTNGATNTRIGGLGAGEGNWIVRTAFSGVGSTESAGTVMLGNRIGTDLAGTTNWGTTSAGIYFRGVSTGALVQGNVVAFSGVNGGVLIDTNATGVALLQNSIYGSAGLGIDLGFNGVTANDAGDADTGANNLQNFPVLTLARTNGAGSFEITGTLNSTANTYLRIEIFANTANDGSGYGEGQTYLGFIDVLTDGSGDATFSETLSATVAAGAFISATATRSNSSFNTFSDTSEFARSVVAISSSQAVLVVDTAADTLDGDTTSLSTLLASKGADGFISLREALTAINNTPAGSLPTRVNFGIAGTGLHTITLASALPHIARPVVIDASTDDSFAANGSRPAIQIDGNNEESGLVLQAAASGSTIRGLAITNFFYSGIYIESGSDNNVIAGNYLGTVGAGGTLLATTVYTGIWVDNASNNRIGGSTAADRNLIVGVPSSAVLIDGPGADANIVQGNWIGVMPDGVTTVASPGEGIAVTGGATQTQVGGLGAGEGNWIVRTDFSAISLVDAVATTVQGNRIGTDLAGTTDLGTGSSAGMYITGATSGGLIQGNVVAFSGANAGILFDGGAPTGITLLGNRIYANAGPGIDLGFDGVTPNDAGDGDTGANDLQNFPVLTLVRTDGAGNVTVTGSINSTADTYIRIEVFSNTVNDATGYGQGQTPLGFIDVLTDGSGNATFSQTLGATVAAGAFISATATRSVAGYGSFSDTSEFARSVVAISTTQSVLVVDTAADTLDGDTTSISTLLATKGADGFISLREAITAINNTPAGSLPTLVNFAISGTGLHTISLAQDLPHIARPVVIDGTTDDSFAANGSRSAIQIVGNADPSKNESGLVLQAGASGSTIRGLAITNFDYTGIYLEVGSNNNVIAGNYIGTVGAGAQVLGTTVQNGIYVDRGSGNRIGGSSAADRNVLAGTTFAAIFVVGTAGTVVQGNYIGVMPDGLSALASTGVGIAVSAGASNTVIGGLADGEGNWIARTSGSAVLLDSATGTRVQGNRIGTDAAGTANWGTTAFAGIYLDNGTAGTLVQGNVVAFSGAEGGIVLLAAAGAGNALLGNQVYGNTGLGIDLGSDGVTANDTGDADTGANNLQNFPVLTLARTNGAGSFEIAGTINSTANTYIRIELFANTANDASGYGEGQTYLGFVNVLTDGAGNATFSTTLAATVAAGAFISATATRSVAGYGSFSDTSELARSVVAISTTQNVLVVDTAADTLDGDTTSISTLLASKGADGFISLREAITAINNTPAGGLPTLVNFDIAGSGVHTIVLSSALPVIDRPVVIDGMTDTASVAANGGRPAIVVDGNGAAIHGLVLGANADGSTLRGLVVTNLTGNAIWVQAGSDGNTIAGNYVGAVAASGTATAAATGNGIRIEGANNVVGGSTAAERNVLAGVTVSAIAISGASAAANVVQGNWINVLPDGVTTVASAGDGIAATGGATNTRIGGANAGEGNWVVRTAFSAVGAINATGTTVEGNRVGTDLAGTTNLGTTAAGMYFAGLTAGTLVQNNVVAFSGVNGGVLVDASATGVALLRNSIYGGAGLGIDLGFDGVTANDTGDGDTGANNLQNYPVLASVAYASNQFTVTGSLNTEANKTYRIEFFGIPYGSADASGNGEGNVFLGFVEVTTNASGNATINTVLAANGLSYGAYVTATATEKTGASSYGSTSEFSANVQAANTAPVLTVAASAGYTENAAAVALAPAATAVDTELAAAGSYAGATLTLSRNGGANAQDLFAATGGSLSALTQGAALVYGGTTVGTVTTNSGGTLVLSFDGNATQALVNNVLRAIGYANSSDAPPASVQLNWSFSDGNGGAQGSGGALAGTGSTTVNITAVNDAPVVTATGTALAYTENAAATAIDPGLVVSDVDSANLAGATVAITGNYANGQDVLAFTNANGITGSWNAATGVLTLSGSATVANYQAALRSVTYVNTSDNPSTATRTVSFTATDGALGSTAATRDIAVTAVNDAPVVTTTGTVLAYTENAAATAIDPGLVVSDVDIATLTGATVAISANYVNGEDVLAFTNANGITGSWNAATGVLTLTGAASAANYQAALRSITYLNTSDNPSTATRTVSFAVTDGAATSATATRDITVTAVNDAPVVTTTGTTLGTTENAAATVVDAGVTVSDLDNTTLASATVSISANYANGQDVLAFVNANGITGSWNAATGVLTLSGTASVANYQAALHSITYVNTSDNPSTTTRTVSFVVNDGAADSTAATRNIAVTAVNDAPVVTTTGTALAYTENAAATAVEAGLTVADPDNANLTGATVSISANYVNGEDVLVLTNANGITGSWNAATGVLTLSGSASVANYQLALRSITYVNTSDNPGTATRTVSFSATDGTATSAVATRDITVTAVNDLPVLTTTGSTLATTENDPATAIDPGLTVSDADNASLSGATVTVSGNYVNGQDVLAFVNANGITGNWNAATGVLTLSGTASVANYQAALRSVTYLNTSDNPSTATRTISFVANDGTADSLPATRDIAVTAVNDAPVVTTTGSTLAYTENAAATAVDPGLTVSDVDSANLTGATVAIGANYINGEDVLAFVNANGITGSWNAATGVLTLTGSATVASYQAALRSVTYVNTSDDPSTATRTVAFTATDGTATSAVATRNIAVTAVNDAPVVVTTGTTLGYAENAAATVVDPGVTVSDADNTTLAGATVSSSANYANGQDVLAFTNANGITGSWNAATGVLTLSGTASVANYQAALRSVTYVNTSDNPSTATRAVSFTVNDGAADSTAATRNIAVTAVDDAPVVATTGTALPSTENHPATAVDAGVTVSDADNTTLAGATVAITANYANGQDVLAFVNANGITGSWNAATGVLTLSGTASVANYQAALRSVTYTNTSDNPSTATRTVSFTVSDGTASSAAATRDVALTATNDAPLVTATGTPLGITENAPATAIDGGVTVSDVDNTTLSSATVSISANYANGQDVLAFANANGITGSWNAATGVLTLTGTASVANYQAALRSVTYTNTSDNPSTATRTVSFTVSDGALNSTAATRDIAVTAVNDAPVVTTAGTALPTTENDPATAIDAGITVSDVDNTTLSGATVAITGNYANGQDVLAFVNAGGITGSWNAATGVLTLSGTASVATYQAALRSVTYANTSDNPSTATRTVAFAVNDGAAISAAATRDITVAAVNDAPVVATTGTALPITENAAATAIDPALTVSDVDTTTLAGATVAITGNYVNGQDVLAFTNANGITGSWNAATGVLTLTGTASVADYQAALRSVTYTNTSDNPSTATRTVSFTVSDGALGSTPATRDIAITAVNDAPVVATTGTALPYAENAAATAIDPGLAVSDVDNTLLAGATVAITGNYVSGQDLLAFVNANGITGSWNAATGTLTLTGTASVANYQAALRSVTYANTSDNPSTATRTVAFTVRDGSATSAAATRSLNVVSVSDAPAGADNSVTTLEDTPYTFTVADFGFSDLDGDALLAVHITTLPSVGSLRLDGVAVTAGQTVAVADIAAGKLRFTPAADGNGAAYTSFSFQVQDNGGTANGGADTDPTPRTMTIDVTPVNDPPAITSNGGGATAAVGIDENTTAVTTVVANDIDGPTLTYTISGGADAALFGIDSATGALRFTTAPDYEAPGSAAGNNVYEVVVRASDGTSTATQAITVTVRDVNEFAVGAPIDADAAPNTVPENAATGTLVGITAQAVDPDGTATVRYSLANSAGGRFAIDAVTGVVTVLDGTLLDYETATSHQITVLATSSDGSTASSSFTIALTDENEAVISPVVDTDPAPNRVPENAATGATVGITAFARDPDAGATVSYSLLDDAGGRFRIDAVTGVVTVADGSLLDFEGATSHQIVVRATSSDTSTTDLAFTIGIGDVNEFSVGVPVDVNATPNAVDENAANGTAVGITAFASDADGSNNAVTYSLLDDAGGRFRIDATTGVVTVANGQLLDFETAASHAITVQALSQDGSSATQVFTIALRDANDAPTGTPVVQGLPEQGQVLQADTSAIRDADGLGAFGYQWLRDGQVVAGATGSTYTLGAADVGTRISVRVQYTDGLGTAEALLSLPAGPVGQPNQAPVIVSDGGGATAQVRMDENGVSVTTVSATDVDRPAQTLTYRIVGGADRALFALDASTGALRFVAAPDYEKPLDSGGRNVYEVVVAASDARATTTQTVWVNVADTNDNPPVIAGPAQAVAVVSPGQGDTVFTVSASDADQSFAAPVYAIVGGADAARFQIQSSTGALRLVQWPVAPAGGGTVVLEVIVQASDGMHQATQRLLVAVDFGAVAEALPEESAPVAAPQVAPQVAAASVDAPAGVVVEALQLAPPSSQEARLAELLRPAGGARGGDGNEATRAFNVGGLMPGAGRRGIDVLLPRGADDIAWAQQPMEFALLSFLRAVSIASDGMTPVSPPERMVAEVPTLPAVDGGLNLTMVDAAGIAFTFSFALWMARGGSLLASMLASSPVWVRFDLLPVLERPRSQFASTRETDRARGARRAGPRLSAEERFFAALPPTAE